MLQGHLSIWKQRNLKKIQEAVIGVVNDVGMRVENNSILEILSEKGAIIDKKSKIAKFPAKMVEDIIGWFQKNKPNGKNQSDTFTAKIDGGGAPFFLDHSTGKKRKATRNDLINVIRLGDSLKEVETIGDPLTNSESYAIVEPIETCALLLQYTKKPCHVEVTAPEQIEYLVKMAEIFEYRPSELIAAVSCVISPLIYGQNTAELTLQLAKYGLPSNVGTMPISGLNSPVTLAGSVVIASAEIICGLIINKTINEVKIGKSRKTRSSATISAVLDMRTAKPRWAFSEAVLQDIGVYELLKNKFGIHIHLLPSYIDSKVPGIQSVYERIFKKMAYGAAVNISYFRDMEIGRLDAGNVFSPVQAMLDLEYGKRIWRFSKGIEINEETLALDVIKEVGVGGNYLEHKHTARNFRKELLFPELIYRTTKQEGKNLLEIAYEKYRNVLETYEPPSVDESRKTELQKLLKHAKSKLIGN